MKLTTPIREAAAPDRDAIRKLYLCSFDERENQAVAGLAVDLLELQTSPATVSLVAVKEHAIIGHISLSPVSLDGDAPGGAYILAPLAVDPTHQKQGIGTKLVEAGKNHLADAGVSVLLVYGDPQYYSRFGFSAELGKRFVPPFPLQMPPGWQALQLSGDQLSDMPISITCVGPLSKPSLW